MESSTKLSIPPDSLADLLQATFKAAPTLISCRELSTHRNLNTVYLLNCTAPNCRLILKLPPPPESRVLRSERNIFQVEHLVRSFLISKGVLQHEEPYLYDPSQSVLDASFLIRPYIEGTPLSLPSPDGSSERVLGEYLARINSETSPTGAFGSFISPRYTTYEQYFHQLIEGVMHDGEELLVLLPYEQIRSMVSKWSWTLNSVDKARLVILGLEAGEVLLGDDGEVKGMAGGWERAVWGCEELQLCLRGNVWETWNELMGMGGELSQGRLLL